jgi:hypothetical protein
MRQVIFWVLFVFGVATSLTPGVFLLMLNAPSPVQDLQVRVLTPVVAPGQEFQVEISSVLTDECSGTIWRSIIDSAGVRTEYQPAVRPDQATYTVKLTVPLGANPGVAYYQVKVEWVCNAVQRVFPRVTQQRAAVFVIKPLPGQIPDLDKQGVYRAPDTLAAEGASL